MNFEFNKENSQKVFFASFTFLGVLFVGLCGFFLWAWFGNLEESITGTGQLIPEGKLRRVMAPTNGIIAKVHVKENQLVRAGQLVIELDPEPATLEKESFSEQLAYLRQEALALRVAAGESSQRAGLNGTQYAWLNATRETYKAQLQEAEMQIKKSEYLRGETLEKIKSKKESLKSKEKMLKQYRQLYEEDGLTEKDLKDYEADVIADRGMLEALKQEEMAYKTEIEGAKQKKREVSSVYQRDILNKLSEHERDLMRLNSELSKSKVNLKHQLILAPIDGIVNEQVSRGLGEVVTMGETLLSLVPIEAEVIAEVQITNRDMSYVHMGQKAALKLDAFPFQQFGKLEGTIISISPSTVQDKEGRPFYIVRIKPDRQSMKRKNRNYALRPGMTLSADIITHEKPILSFFIEPIQERLDRAFRDPSNK